MNVLFTGSCGQLGQALRKTFSYRCHNCVFTDVTDAEGIEVLDVTDSEAVRSMLDARDIDVIVNCAAYTDVNKAEDDEVAAFRINASAPAVLAEAAREKGALLVHISTDYIFDGHAYVPYKEDAPASPLNVYGCSKLAGEKAVVESGCRYVILRTSWMYSCFGRNFFMTMAELLADRSSIEVVDDQIGTPTYAPDLAETVADILEHTGEDICGIYNYSDEGVCSWYDFAKEICRGLGYLCNVLPCTSEAFAARAVRPHFSVLDKSKIKRTFGIEIPHWRESLDMCILDYSRAVTEQ